MKADEKKPAKTAKPARKRVGIKAASAVDVVCLEEHRIERGNPIEVSAKTAAELLSRSNVLQIVKG